MRQEQALRHWKILLRLEEYRYGLTPKELAEEFGVSDRTIYRDLLTLQSAGFPITNEKRQGKMKYFLINHPGILNKINFSPTELLALHLSKGILSQLEGTIFHDAIEQLLYKIEEVMPGSMLDYFQELETGIFVQLFQRRDYEKKSKEIEAILSSLRGKKTLDMVYFSPQQGEMRRKVDPYCLWVMGDSLYLIGFCHIHKEIRTFLVDRIKKAIPTKKEFKIQGHFNFQDYARESFRVMRGGEIEEYELKFAPQVSYFIQERTWHPTQKIIKHRDGSITLKFRARGRGEVKSWVLSFGNLVEVKKPEGLRKEIKQTLMQTLEKY